MFISSPTGLLVVHHSAKQLNIEFPKPAYGLSLSTAKSIYNAWMNTAIIDNYGMVWILPNSLAQILRTSKPNAKHIVDKIGRQYKTQGAEGTYLHYAEVIMLAGSIKRESYAEYSESIGLAIRNSAQAKYQRAQTYESLKEAKKKLRQQRVNWLKIGRDELTGTPLTAYSQFSHIRSCAIYPQLTACIWNGLVVNKQIHQTITDAYINDEDELYDLCQKHQWSTDWYDKYKAELN